RGVAPDVSALYAATAVVGFGVAIMHPAMPPLARIWLPDRTGFATAVYANGLLIGEILPVLLMVPVVLPLVGGSWRLGFAFWAAPCVVIAAIIFFASPRGLTARDAPQVSLLWWPDWSSGLLWRLGLTLGGANASYFTTNHFLPDYLHQGGNGDLVGPALMVLNIVQLPGSFLLLWLASRFERRSSSYVFFGCVALMAALGIILGNGPIIVASAGLIGFSTSSVLILILALPPLVSRQEDVPRVA